MITIGRMDYAYNLQEEAFFLGPYEPMMIKHPPSHYLRMMYLESTCCHVPAVRCPWRRSAPIIHLRDRGAAAEIAQAGRRQRDQGTEAFTRRRAEGVRGKCEAAAEDLEIAFG
jgi:hypothetical protein